MKELFTSYFNISIIGCVLILLGIVVRFLIKRINRSAVLVLWIFIFFRLLIPFQMNVPFSLRPDVPALNSDATGIFRESSVISEEDVPAYIPQLEVSDSNGQKYIKIDYISVLAYLWQAGILAGVMYLLISLYKLKLTVREAIRLKDNIYQSSKVKTAFLLGYISPKIFLPCGMSESVRDVVISHELVHRKYGHNWLKLFGFLAAVIHWYNPLAWIAYILFCADIEFVCDEIVVRNMTAEERKSYSRVLLLCASEKRMLMSGPMPFGETNIKERIMNVLKNRKPLIWTTVAAFVIVIFVVGFFMTDPQPQYPQYYSQLIQLIGQPKNAVEEKLKITLETEEMPQTGFYMTPLKAEYNGVDLNIRLGFSIVDDCLWSFQYIASYDDKDEAAKDTVKVVKELLDDFGSAEQNINKRTLLLSEITTEAVKDKFENKWITHEGIDSVGGYWMLTDCVSPSTLNYWEGLTESDAWNTFWHERAVSLDFMLEMQAWCEANSDNCHLILDFNTKYSFKTVYEYVE